MPLSPQSIFTLLPGLDYDGSVSTRPLERHTADMFCIAKSIFLILIPPNPTGLIDFPRTWKKGCDKPKMSIASSARRT